MATLTVYPDAGDPGTTSVDGRVIEATAGTNWAGKRDATVGTSVASTGASGNYIVHAAGAAADTWDTMVRSMFLFDTSALTAAANITAAVLSLRGTSKFDTLSATTDIDIYTTTPASSTTLVTEDYDQFGTTSQTGSPITYANWSTAGYNDFTFNATGRGNISKTGISKFGTRSAKYDVANTPPTWASGGGSNLGGNFADVAGTTDDPKLVITYTTTLIGIPIGLLLVITYSEVVEVGGTTWPGYIGSGGYY